MTEVAGRRSFKVFGQEFIVDARYNVTKELGQGAYGIVCAAQAGHDPKEQVAVKKITNVFSKQILAKRALREIKLLQHFRGHRNITCLFDMDIPGGPSSYNEVYLYEELMECDLAAIIRSGQPLTDAHFQSFIYQILCGLKYIHSANVLHRDLKPGNLLVNADCELKICDFGLARGFSNEPDNVAAGFQTEYVATRWYRAPEIMLSFAEYTKAIDVWSVGCILAELLGGKPFLKGKDYVDQLNQILHVLGTPDESTLQLIGSPRAREYVRGLPYMPRIPYQQFFPRANPDALDLLEKMLAFVPAKRITTEEALEHPYLAIWHDPSDEPACPTKFDFRFEVVKEIPELRTIIFDEVRRFRGEVRAPLQQQQQQQQQHYGDYQQQAGQVPMPDQWNPRQAEDPRPQALGESTTEGLERELEYGLDAQYGQQQQMR
ncbi:mitogen-activated protein kinase spm1 [Aureobasidium namibiae CBS 147.97]|uniref:Mitogen-activated protein kinase n=1 Tax=Aureobasidium namibiae CBS 147.97 TaxID=1043004 RepID=A0A074WUL7_9PEZI